MNEFTVITEYIHGTKDGYIHASSIPHIDTYRIPREYVDELKNVPGLRDAGIYILVGDGTVYIGQADNRENGKGLLGRMLEPHGKAGIDDWSVGYALSVRSQVYFGATELNYLERYFYDEAKKNGRYTILNGNRPHATEPNSFMKSAINNFVEFAKFILAEDLGCQVYVPGPNVNPTNKISNPKPDSTGVSTIPSQPSAGDVYSLVPNKSGASATAEIIDGKKTIVRAGAVVSLENHLANQKGQGGSDKLRKQLESDGTIVDGVFTKDYTFSSTSAAAAVLLGSASQGPEKWIKAGKKLSAILKGQ